MSSPAEIRLSCKHSDRYEMLVQKQFVGREVCSEYRHDVTVAPRAALIVRSGTDSRGCWSGMGNTEEDRNEVIDRDSDEMRHYIRKDRRWERERACTVSRLPQIKVFCLETLPIIKNPILFHAHWEKKIQKQIYYSVSCSRPTQQTCCWEKLSEVQVISYRSPNSLFVLLPTIKN